MVREIYTYTDLTKLPESRQFAEIKQYPIITVSSDLEHCLKGRYEFDRFNGMFRTDEKVHVVDFRKLVNLIDENWRTDQTKFNQMVILSEFVRGKLEKAGDDQAARNWYIGCMRNLGRMLSSIRLMEECCVLPEDLEPARDRNMALLIDAWRHLYERDPLIERHRSRMRAMSTKNAWKTVLESAFHMTDVSDVDTLVFHGFYYITPHQEYVMQKLEESGFRLIFLIPYDERHPFVHEIWDRTYSEQNGYPAKSAWHLEKNQDDNPWAEIFEGKEVRIPNKVQIREYASMMEFVDDVKRIREKGYNLYSHDFQSANRILQDYFPEEYGERKILSYPIGQFINDLNQMWDADRQTIMLDEDLLIECFSSGWLAKNGVSGRQYLQDLVYILPFFTGCRTPEEWEKRIGLLKQIEEDVLSAFQVEEDMDPAIARWQEATANPLTYISTFSVQSVKLDVILQLIQQLLQMAKDLFRNNQTVEIQEHVRNLDYILKQNEVSEELYTEERELVAEIFETLTKPSDFSTRCYPSDISKALSIYISGRLSDGEIQTNRIGMVNPMYFMDAACIKNKGKIHVCFCDVDNMPGRNKDYIWPLSESVVKKCWQQTENSLLKNLMHIMEVSSIANRYFMYVALRNKDVQLSWVNCINEKLLAPSSYLKLVEESAGVLRQPAKRNEISFSQVTDSAWASDTIKPYHYEEMPSGTIKEARMDYVLCPMRYILSYVVEKYPTYQSVFQQNYALNAIISAVGYLLDEEGNTTNEVYRNLMTLFPNLRRIEKRQVYDYIGNDHGEHDMDYGNRTKIGKWYMTDERLKIHYPGQVSRRQAYSLYGKQSTPDKKDGMNLFSQMDTTEMKRGAGREICAFCPHINNCRNALFHEDQERMYD